MQQASKDKYHDKTLLIKLLMEKNCIDEALVHMQELKSHKDADQNVEMQAMMKFAHMLKNMPKDGHYNQRHTGHPQKMGNRAPYQNQHKNVAASSTGGSHKCNPTSNIPGNKVNVRYSQPPKAHHSGYNAGPQATVNVIINATPSSSGQRSPNASHTVAHDNNRGRGRAYHANRPSQNGRGSHFQAPPSYESVMAKEEKSNNGNRSTDRNQTTCRGRGGGRGGFDGNKRGGYQQNKKH